MDLDPTRIPRVSVLADRTGHRLSRVRTTNRTHIQNRPSVKPSTDEQPFAEYDQRSAGEQLKQYLQETIDYIGADRFD
ncbi:hypothetical protein [Halocatena pleomorpha]|uniref:Uncharacterized protein n=1 Tax=Halocatena pleomorpha TaxID=1785090 RepID=A0A3P3R9C9_9EURY|nr:hypothetical protein [Halocatena pleomorpha]RRJ30067.1 hypothetical protein EIK79_10810 [Halocatena pleomorpha]